MRRLLPFLGVLAFAVAGLAWLAQDPGSGRSRPGSTFDTSGSGASLAFAYLEGRGGDTPVGRLAGPLRLSEVKPETVVFRLRPARFPRRMPVAETDGRRPDQSRRRPPSKPASKKDAPQDRDAAQSRDVEEGRGPQDGRDPEDGRDRDERDPEKMSQPPLLLDPREQAWVEAGGRLVLAVADPIGSLKVEAAATPPRKVHPRWPAVSALRPSPRRVLGGAAVEDAVTLFASGDRPVVARVARGGGEVVLLACPEVLENGLLARGDHLRLLEALAGTGRPVLFDEHAHGIVAERGLTALLLDWGLGPSLGLAALAGLALLWRSRVRVGPAEDAWEDRRSDAVDLVGSMAQLYERALRRNEAASLYHEAFRRAAAQRSGLRGRDLDARVRQMTGGIAPAAGSRGRDMSEAELADVLARVNRAFGGLGHGHSR